MGSSKDLKPLQKRAKAQGWEITRSRSGKLKWCSPEGGMPYFSSFTPSDRRAVHNIEAALTKMGLKPV